jgi:hypothetical protein
MLPELVALSRVLELEATRWVCHRQRDKVELENSPELLDKVQHKLRPPQIELVEFHHNLKVREEDREGDGDLVSYSSLLALLPRRAHAKHDDGEDQEHASRNRHDQRRICRAGNAQVVHLVPRRWVDHAVQTKVVPVAFSAPPTG